MIELACPKCGSINEKSGNRFSIVKDGYFVRQRDRAKQQRYYCRSCGKAFSDSTFTACYKQKKRDINLRLFELLCMSTCQNDLAKHLKVNRKTVIRKFRFLGRHSAEILREQNQLFAPSTSVQFDEFETCENTKLKPIHGLVVVDAETSRVLGFGAASAPPKSKASARAKARYGVRPDTRRAMRDHVCESLKPFVNEKAIFESDKHPHYPSVMRRNFPKAKHVTYISKRARDFTQGEKKKGYDPLGTINHVLAMMKAKMGRLLKQNWNRSRKISELLIHLAIYSVYYNWALHNDLKRPLPWAHLEI